MSNPLWYYKRMIMNDKMKIELNVTETHARVDNGELATCDYVKTPWRKILNFHSFDVAGQDGVLINIEGVGEFVSYDEGDSWQDME